MNFPIRLHVSVEIPITVHFQSKVNLDSENTRTKNTYSSRNQRMSHRINAFFSVSYDPLGVLMYIIRFAIAVSAYTCSKDCSKWWCQLNVPFMCVTDRAPYSSNVYSNNMFVIGGKICALSVITKHEKRLI